MKTKDNEEPSSEWLQVAVNGFQEIKKSWGCTTLSALHNDGSLSMKTLGKLDPRDPDPAIGMETVVMMIGKLMNVAPLLFSDSDLVRVQSTLTSVLVRVVAASVPLTSNDRAKAMERRRIRYKHNI